jgi:hypothetical protein
MYLEGLGYTVVRTRAAVEDVHADVRYQGSAQRVRVWATSRGELRVSEIR